MKGDESNKLDLRDYLVLPYGELEEKNLAAKQDRAAFAPADEIREKRIRYLTDEKKIKAVTVCFSDLEGRLHMLDYDKKHLLRSDEALPFDGSSVRGYESTDPDDLWLGIDWSAFYWLPADVFGPGKVIVFGEVRDREGTGCEADFRSRLRTLSAELRSSRNWTAMVSADLEGFLFNGCYAEQQYGETGNFKFVSSGGYYHSLPQDQLRRFIDAAADVQRAMAFVNERDHPEVGPSQFEMNFAPAEATIAADQMLLYKLICRQVAQRQNLTASFLPKPVSGINANSMQTHLALWEKGRNLFHDSKGKDQLSAGAWDFAARIVGSADELCLVTNPSVNAYRRYESGLDSPIEIKASITNRLAMIRLRPGPSETTRFELRSVTPDANPYLVLYALLRIGLEGPMPEADDEKRPRTRMLPDNIYNALRLFKRSAFMRNLLGEEVHGQYANLKQTAADRCPRELGARIKRSEIVFHHEVTNQMLWSNF